MEYYKLTEEQDDSLEDFVKYSGLALLSSFEEQLKSENDIFLEAWYRLRGHLIDLGGCRRCCNLTWGGYDFDSPIAYIVGVIETGHPVCMDTRNHLIVPIFEQHDLALRTVTHYHWRHLNKGELWLDHSDHIQKVLKDAFKSQKLLTTQTK
jgi:hypothetical protein